MIFHQIHHFLAISRHSRYKIFKQNSQHLMFLLPFMVLKYPLMLEIHLKFFQKQHNSLIKNIWNIQIFLIHKKGKVFERGKADQSHLSRHPSSPSYSHKPHLWSQVVRSLVSCLKHFIDYLRTFFFSKF